jgi:methyl-accepting chemotaxis protein
MTAKRWENIRNDWRALRKEALALPAEISFRRHSELIRAVLYSMGDVAERSQIAGECAADTSLVDALWSKLPSVAESLGQARGIGASVAAKCYCSSVARIKLRFLEERVSETMVYVNNELAHVDLAHAASFTQSWKETHTAVQAFLKLLDESLLKEERPTIDAEHYFSAGTKAMDAVFHAFDQASSVLESVCSGTTGDARTV